MTHEHLPVFVATLSTTDWRRMTSEDKRRVSDYIESDGSSTCARIHDNLGEV